MGIGIRIYGLILYVFGMTQRRRTYERLLKYLKHRKEKEGKP